MHRYIAAVPLADPETPLGIRPDAARALIGRRRFDNIRRAVRAVDLGDVIAGERGVPDVALRRQRHAIRSAAARRWEDLDVAGFRIEAAVDTALAGKPV